MPGRGPGGRVFGRGPGGCEIPDVNSPPREVRGGQGASDLQRDEGGKLSAPRRGVASKLDEGIDFCYVQAWPTVGGQSNGVDPMCLEAEIAAAASTPRRDQIMLASPELAPTRSLLYIFYSTARAFTPALPGPGAWTLKVSTFGSR